MNIIEILETEIDILDEQIIESKEEIIKLTSLLNEKQLLNNKLKNSRVELKETLESYLIMLDKQPK